MTDTPSDRFRTRRATAAAAAAALAFALGGCGSAPSARDPIDAPSPRGAASSSSLDDDEARLLAARSVGENASASLVETERTRKYLRSHRIYEVSSRSEEGAFQWKRVVVGPDGRVLSGQRAFSVPAREGIRIGDERTAREVGALLTDLVQPGNSVLEATVDRLAVEKRYDVVVVTMTGGPRYGHSQLYRWTFALTPAAEVIIQYRSPVAGRPGG